MSGSIEEALLQEVKKTWDAKLLGGSIKRGIVNPDLQQERDSCAFDKVELEKFVWGDEIAAYLTEKHAMFQSDPKFRLPDNMHEMTKAEQLEEWWRVNYHVMQHKEGKFHRESLKYYEEH